MERSMEPTIAGQETLHAEKYQRSSLGNCRPTWEASLSSSWSNARGWSQCAGEWLEASRPCGIEPVLHTYRLVEGNPIRGMARKLSCGVCWAGLTTPTAVCTLPTEAMEKTTPSGQ
jgi:hypothetical protein